MKLLENKKFIATVLALNCIVICVLVGYLLYVKTREYESEKQPTVTKSSDVVTFDQSDKELADIYVSLLQGSHFDLEDNIHFYFNENGEYSGFFDAANPDVTGYYYYIGINNGTVYLRIFNEDKSKVVQYEVSFDDEDNIVLKHPDMEKEIILSY